MPGCDHGSPASRQYFSASVNQTSGDLGPPDIDPNDDPFFICFVTTVKFNVFFQWKRHDYAIARKHQETTTANDEECLRRKTCIHMVWTFNSPLSTPFGLRRLRIFSD